MSEENKGFILKDSEDSSEGKGEKGSVSEDQKKGGFSLPAINFSTFIFSLNSSALVLLGAVEDPATGKKEKNIPMAKQTIDIIGMLEEKTKGNLTIDEENLLKNILHDLRILFVKEK